MAMSKATEFVKRMTLKLLLIQSFFKIKKPEKTFNIPVIYHTLYYYQVQLTVHCAEIIISIFFFSKNMDCVTVGNGSSVLHELLVFPVCQSTPTVSHRWAFLQKAHMDSVLLLTHVFSFSNWNHIVVNVFASLNWLSIFLKEMLTALTDVSFHPIQSGHWRRRRKILNGEESSCMASSGSYFLCPYERVHLTMYVTLSNWIRTCQKHSLSKPFKQVLI